MLPAQGTSTRVSTISVDQRCHRNRSPRANSDGRLFAWRVNQGPRRRSEQHHRDAVEPAREPAFRSASIRTKPSSNPPITRRFRLLRPSLHVERRCDVADARGLQLRDLCAEGERRRSRFRHLQIHLQTTPLPPDITADQGFYPDLTMGGILTVHPSDTPKPQVTGLASHQLRHDKALVEASRTL